MTSVLDINFNTFLLIRLRASSEPIATSEESGSLVLDSIAPVLYVSSEERLKQQAVAPLHFCLTRSTPEKERKVKRKT